MPWETLYQPLARDRPVRLARLGRREDNLRRAARNVYLRIRHARLGYMWTLTYAPKPGCPEGRLTRGEVFGDLKDFYRRLQRETGRQRIVGVVERGARNGRLHAHLAVGPRIDFSLLKRAWGHGGVRYGDPGNLPGDPGPRELSGYMAKYLTKDVADDQLEPGGHAYSCTRGWEPPEWRRRFWTDDDAVAWLRQVMGEAQDGYAWGRGRGAVGAGRVLIYGDAQLWPAWDALDELRAGGHG